MCIRDSLATASAYQNANFDSPAQGRAWYFFRQGEMAFEAGDNDTALGDEREAVTVFPNYADALRTLARIECARHDWQQCLVDAEASSNIVPYPETLGYKACLLYTSIDSLERLLVHSASPLSSNAAKVSPRSISVLFKIASCGGPWKNCRAGDRQD